MRRDSVWSMLALALVGMQSVKAEDCGCQGSTPPPCNSQTVQCPVPRVVVEMSPPEVVFRQATACAPSHEHFSLFKHHVCAPAPAATTTVATTYQTVMPIAIPQATYTYVPVQTMAIQAAPALSYQMAPAFQAAPAMTYAAAPAPTYQMAPMAQAAPMLAYQAAPQVSYQMAPAQYMQAQPVQQVAMQLMAPANNVMQQSAPPSLAIPCIPQNNTNPSATPTAANQDPNNLAFLKGLKDKVDALNPGDGKKTGTSPQSKELDCCSQLEDLKQRVAVLKSLVDRNTGILEKHNDILRKNGLIQ